MNDVLAARGGAETIIGVELDRPNLRSWHLGNHLVAFHFGDARGPRSIGSRRRFARCLESGECYESLVRCDSAKCEHSPDHPAHRECRSERSLCVRRALP